MALNPNKCPYCGKEFSRERTLQVHMCEPKRRHLQKNEKWVQNGFMVFQRFYEIHQKQSKQKTYEQFCDSSYYNAFVKFGRYMMHIAPLYPEKFIDYVILSKIKLDHWTRDDLYETYLIDTLKAEPVEAALRRSIVNTNRSVQHIQQGKISPWLLFGCKAGKNLLQSLNDEQLQIVAKFIAPEFWTQRIKSSPADQLFVQETAKEAKIE